MPDIKVSTVEVPGGPTVHVYRAESDGRWVVDIDTLALEGVDVIGSDDDSPRMRVWVNDALIHDEHGRCKVLR